MTVNAATGQTQLYQSLFGQNATSAPGTTASGATGGTASAGQDVSSLLQELLGGAAGTAQGTSSAPSPVSNTSPSSQLASNTLASLLSAQGGVSDLNSIISELATVASGASGSLDGSALAEQLNDISPDNVSSTTITPPGASTAGPQGASGGGESISSILATLLADSASTLLGATSSLGTTSLSASTVASSPSTSNGSATTGSGVASGGPTASVAAQALNQLAGLLQNLTAQLATSQYANANQLTNPTAVGATFSSVA